jgi:hypothetical protein
LTSSVLLSTKLLVSRANSCERASANARSASLQPLSRPRSTGAWYVRLNSPASRPRAAGFTNDTTAYSSSSWFCSGVPVRMIRRGVGAAFRALMVWFPAADLSRWPSSHTNSSNPGVAFRAAACFRYVS